MTGTGSGDGSGDGSSDGPGVATGVGVGDGVGSGSNGTTFVPTGVGDGDAITATGSLGAGLAAAPTTTPTSAVAASAAAARGHRIPPPWCDDAGHVSVSATGLVNRPFASRPSVTRRSLNWAATLEREPATGGDRDRDVATVRRDRQAGRGVVIRDQVGRRGVARVLEHVHRLDRVAGHGGERDVV